MNEQNRKLLEKIDEQLKDKLSSITFDLTEIQQLIDSTVPEPSPGPVIDSSLLLDSLNAIKQGTNQKAIIHELIMQIGSMCRGCGLVLLAKDNTVVWLGPGFGLPADQAVGTKRIALIIDQDSLITAVATTGEAYVSSSPKTATEISLYRELNISAPTQIVLIPLTINGRVQAVVIADSVDDEVPDPAALSIMVGIAGASIEHLPFRDKLGYSRFATIRKESVSEKPSPQTDREDVTVFDYNVEEMVTEPEEETLIEEEEIPVIDEELPSMEPVEEMAETPVAEKAEEVTLDQIDDPTAVTVDSYARELEMEIGDDMETSASVEIDVSEMDIEEIKEDMVMEPVVEEPAPIVAGPVDEMAKAPVETTIPVAEEEPDIILEDVQPSQSTEILIDEDDQELELLDTPDAGIEMQTRNDFTDSGLQLATESATEDESVEEVELTIEEGELSTGEVSAAAGEIDLAVDEIPSSEIGDMNMEDTGPMELEIAEPEEKVTAQKPVEATAQPAATDTQSYESYGLSSYDLDKYEGDDRKQHEKAIRFARLLVSEIKLYNEEQVALGRESADLGTRLREDISRSRTLFEQRIPGTIRSHTNYFDSELVRQLANGDESLMGT